MAVAFGVADAEVVAFGVARALEVALGVALGVACSTVAASRVTPVWPVCRALVLAGGWPQTLDAAVTTTCSLAAASFAVAASAGAAPASRLPTIPDEIRAAPAAAPSAEGP